MMHERDRKDAFDRMLAMSGKASEVVDNYIARHAGPADNEYVKAFERNCPGVRMTPDERNELRRLFHEATQARAQPTERR